MTNTVAQAIAYAQNHPTRDGDGWDGWCESFVHRAGGFTNSFDSARLARLGSHVYPPSKLPIDKVPNGWLLHWDYGTPGHIAIMTPHGALMASRFITNKIHNSLGYIKAADYERLSGHRYLGASPDHGGQYMAGIQRTPNAPKPNVKPKPAVKKPGRTLATLATGSPNNAFYKRLQWYAHLNGYAGPIDGIMGTLSWKGVQTGLKHWGYTGPLDGKPGVNTYKALQRMAQEYGGKGITTGKLTGTDYRAIAKRLNLL